jgi:hypothetical protein
MMLGFVGTPVLGRRGGPYRPRAASDAPLRVG